MAYKIENDTTMKPMKFHTCCYHNRYIKQLTFKNRIARARRRTSWKPILACDPWDARTKLNLLRCSGHMQTGGVRATGFLQFRYDVLAKG